METPTLFEAVGGHEAVLGLAHAWHRRVLADEVVAHAFSHGFHPQHMERLAAYWCEAWGGPPVYTSNYGSESTVVRMHSGNGEHGDMDQRAIDCFALALSDVAIDEAKLRQCLLDYFVWATHVNMTAYPDSAADVPPTLTLPKWSWQGLVNTL